MVENRIIITMTEVSNNTVIVTVKEENQRTREAIAGMSQDIRDLPGAIAQAFTAQQHGGSSAPSGSPNMGWILTTAISVLLAVGAIVNGQVAPIRDAQEGFETAAIQRIASNELQIQSDNPREESTTSRVSVVETRVNELESNKNTLFVIMSRKSAEANAEYRDLIAAQKIVIDRYQRERSESIHNHTTQGTTSP
jgi:hypothetical protein